jgi:maltose alpha-D-glucosyltransferase/alpha-amylase
VKSSEIVGVIPTVQGSPGVQVALLQVEYTEGDPETYVIPVVYDPPGGSRSIESPQHGLVARLTRRDGRALGALYDAMLDPSFGESLLDAIGRRRSVRTANGVLVGTPSPAFASMAGGSNGAETATRSSLSAAEQREQTNSSFVFGERLMLKLFRKLESGMNPDLEVARFLAGVGFPHTPPLAGAIEYRRGRGEPTTVAILQGYVVNEGDAWHLALDAARESFERALARPDAPPLSAPSASGLLALAAEEPSEAVKDVVGPFLESVRLLGVRTAELHLALASEPTNPAFAPEPFSALYRRSLYQSMRATTDHTFRLLRQRLPSLPEASREGAQHTLSLETEILNRLRAGLEIPINALRIRCHGDYHLGQVLFTGNDFVIIDFEGEPARSITERRIKRTPLRDVAGMLRSFHYAATTELLAARGRIAGLEPEASSRLDAWAREWVRGLSGAFLRAYLERLDGSSILPRGPRELEALLEVSLLEKAVYELGYELNNRPSWVDIPLRGLRELVGAED